MAPLLTINIAEWDTSLRPAEKWKKCLRANLFKIGWSTVHRGSIFRLTCGCFRTSCLCFIFFLPIFYYFVVLEQKKKEMTIESRWRLSAVRGALIWSLEYISAYRICKLCVIYRELQVWKTSNAHDLLSRHRKLPGEESRLATRVFSWYVASPFQSGLPRAWIAARYTSQAFVSYEEHTKFNFIKLRRGCGRHPLVRTCVGLVVS